MDNFKYRIVFLFIITFLLASCYTNRTSVIVGTDFNESENYTEHFVVPYGTVRIPGNWEEGHYNSNSRQQFFTNKDSVSIAIAFNRINNYEFNIDGSKKGFDFVKAFYEWDTKYFSETHGLKNQLIEENTINNFIIYRVYGIIDKKMKMDSYYFVGVKNEVLNSYSVSITDKWNEKLKIDFLKALFIDDK